MHSSRGADRGWSPSVPPTNALRFSAFCLDRDSEGLFGASGQRIKLAPKALALLRYLAERPQRVVTKNELLTALWGDAHVGDAVLKTHLNQVRRALQDDARAPRFIETVGRRGYRFIAPVSRAPIEDGIAMLGSSLSPRGIVGREAELAALNELLQSSWTGKCHLAFVSGEAGAGKTSLVDAFSSGLRDRSALGVCGRCVERHDAGEPYLPFLEAIARLCRSNVGQHLIPLLFHYAPSWMLELPEWTEPATAPRATGKTASQSMLREMVAAIPVVTRTVPLVLVIEDLHWADPSTIHLIDYLASSSDPSRLLLIATHRAHQPSDSNHPLSQVKRRLRAHQQCRDIELRALAERDVAAYLGARFGEHRFPATVAHAIHLQTGGNPLFMVRVVDDLISRDILREVNGAWRLTGEVAVIARNVPESLVPLIESEVDQLSYFERRLLEAASIAGSEFWSRAIAAVAEEDALRVEDIFMRWSQQGRFVDVERVVRPSGEVELRCRFYRAIYRQVICARLGPMRQTELRRRLESWRNVNGASTVEHAPSRLAVVSN